MPWRTQVVVTGAVGADHRLEPEHVEPPPEARRRSARTARRPSTVGTSEARRPPQRSLGAQPCSATRRTASQPRARCRPASHVDADAAARPRARRRRARTPRPRSSQTASTSTGGSGRLDGARGEQARAGEHRGQRLGHRTQPGVDDQRQLHRARRTGPSELLDEHGQARDGAGQLAEQPAVAALARGQVPGDDLVDRGSLGPGLQQAAVVDEMVEQRRNGPPVAGLGGGHRRHAPNANRSRPRHRARVTRPRHWTSARPLDQT